MDILFVYILFVTMQTPINSINIELLRDKSHQKNINVYDRLFHGNNMYNNGLVMRQQKSLDHYINMEGSLRKHLTISAALATPFFNVACSPVTTLLTLAKLAFGAETKGDSQNEILKAIAMNNTHQVKHQLKYIQNNLRSLRIGTIVLISRLYVSDTAQLSPEFMKASKHSFDSTVGKIHYLSPRATANTINLWVSVQTSQKITRAINAGKIEDMPSLIAINAAYLVCKWEHPFKKSDEKLLFYTTSGPKIVNAMTSEHNFYYRNSKELKAEIIKIPLATSQAYFLILLPTKKIGLPRLLEKLKKNPNAINDDLNEMKLENVAITIPMFKIHSYINLIPLLKNLDVKQIFTLRSGLNLVVNDDAHVSAATHSALIEVNEGHFVDADIPAFDLKPTLRNTEQIKFKADHPFLFYVISDSEQLFSGILNDPNA